MDLRQLRYFRRIVASGSLSNPSRSFLSPSPYSVNSCASSKETARDLIESAAGPALKASTRSRTGPSLSTARGVVDVLIIGGGNAALCAALAAREAGASVLLLEAAPREWRGGNSPHTRNLRCMHDAPQDVLVDTYPEEEYWQDLLEVTGGQTNEKLARLVIRASSTCRTWMHKYGVRFQPSLSGALHAARTNAFFLGGGKALVNAYYRSLTTLARAFATKRRWTGSNSTMAASRPRSSATSASKRAPACWQPADSNPTAIGCARRGAQREWRVAGRQLPDSRHAL